MPRSNMSSAPAPKSSANMMAVSGANNSELTVAVLGRHEMPSKQCPSWLPSWLCTPIPELITRSNDMAKQQPKPTSKTNQSPRVTTTRPADSPSTVDKPRVKAKPSQQRRRGPNRATTNRGVSEVSETVSNASALSNLDVNNARVTQDELTTASVFYPYSVDMFVYHGQFYPTGDNTTVNSVVRDYFETATGVKLRTDINMALKKSNSVTETEVADYINVVAKAYSLLYSTRRHMSMCYSAKYHNSVRNRLTDIYDESIPTAHMELAAALRAHLLPTRVVEMIHYLYDVYATSDDSRSPLLQMVPQSGLQNSASAYESLMTSEIVNLNNLVASGNAIDIITAFMSDRYPGSTINMSQLQPETLSNDAGRYLENISPKYDRNYLNVWGNLPYLGFNGVPSRITTFDLATENTNVQKFVFSHSFDYIQNSLTSDYNTSVGRYDPGFIVPTMGSGTNRTTLSYIDGNGNEVFLNNTGFGSYALGALSLNGRYALNQTDNVGIRVGGTSLVTTTLREAGQDAYKALRDLMGIPSDR